MHDSDESVIGFIIDILDALVDVVSIKVFLLILTISAVSLLFWEISKDSSWKDFEKIEIKENEKNQITANFDLNLEEDLASESDAFVTK